VVHIILLEVVVLVVDLGSAPQVLVGLVEVE
jgi:hypothetical protein